MMLPKPIPGRECGGCTVCCVVLAIDDPQLKKAEDVPCEHMRVGKGCVIHDYLPVSCRNWYCGWRFLNLSDAMRPDQSHVLLVPEVGSAAGYEKGGLKIVLAEDEVEALFQDEFLNLISRCVAGGIPIFLHRGTGMSAKRWLVNEPLKNAVAQGDRAVVIAILRDGHAQMRHADAAGPP
ncbi:MAG TPA: hypothetical protein VGM26_12040 [Rhizomicrobium sp.]|jgi:hypothetical protein